LDPLPAPDGNALPEPDPTAPQPEIGIAKLHNLDAALAQDGLGQAPLISREVRPLQRRENFGRAPRVNADPLPRPQQPAPVNQTGTPRDLPPLQAPVVNPQPPASSLAAGSLTLEKIDRLPANERLWAENVLFVLKLPSKASQGRVIAGAIASAEMVKQNGDAREQQSATTHLNTVLKAGTPPWKDAKRAMAVTNAKVQLDLLSIPSDQRRLERLGSDQASLNKTFWVNRVGPDGKTAKAFLCKPANPAEREPDGTLSRGGNGLPTGEPMPSGGPRGGEVAREALSGRAALILAAQTSIDIGMPETHVVKLGPQFMPGGDGQNVDDFTCSVQEARPSVGSLKDVDRNRLNADQVAGMAIFDTITLNTDRHAGNVLVDADGNLIPIDHGESFAEPTKGGLARVKVTLGGPHNALLGIPAAHEPMSPKILKGLKALDPGAFAASLTGDRDRVADVHRDMGEMISDGAVEMARRSAEFVRLATRSKIPLSPAAIQVTLGCAADELLDPAVNRKDFTKRAEKLIARAAIEQDAIKQVCLSSGGEYQVLCEQVRALGWQVQDRFMAPAMDALIDPVAMLSVVTNGTRRPAKKKFQIPAELAGGRNANDEQKAKLKVLREAFAAKEKADDALFMDSLHDQLSPATAAATIMNIRNSGISRLLAVVEPAKVAEFKQSAARAELLPASEQAGAFGTLSIAMDAAAMLFQKQRFDRVLATQPLAELSALNLLRSGQAQYGDATLAMQSANALAAASAIDSLEELAARDAFVTAALEQLIVFERERREDYDIGVMDADLVALQDGIAQRAPLMASAALARLDVRKNANAFVRKVKADVV